MSVSRRRFLTNSALVGGAALFGGVGLDALGSRASAATAATLSVALKNNTTSNTVYAYVTGLAINNNALVLLESDGHTAVLSRLAGSHRLGAGGQLRDPARRARLDHHRSPFRRSPAAGSGSPSARRSPSCSIRDPRSSSPR